MWANNFDKCIVCGKDEFPHKWKGLCERCFAIHIELEIEKKRGILSKNKFDAITEGHLIDEYLEKKKTISEIARESGYTNQQIRECLKKYGIQILKIHEEINEEYLKKEYLENHKSISTIAKECGCKYHIICNRLKKYKMQKQDKNNPDSTLIKWAHDFDKCVCCGTTKILHASKGLCRRCYEKYQYIRINPHMYLPPKEKTMVLSKEYLLQEYIKNNKSLSDIAKEYGCTSPFIYKKMKEYGIPRRKKRDARLMALEKGKIKYTRTDKDGNIKEVTHQKSEVDEYFFSYWSAPMAWVLGVIYADGNLDSGRRFGETVKIKQAREPRVSISQKEPEILEKIKALTRSNQKLLFSKQRVFENTTAGECYHLVIRNLQIFRDLTKIGLTPNKSLTITFPDVPKEYLWHFIRGCWDGDGCLSIDKASGQINAGYVSGSKVFIEKFVEILKKELSLEKISIFHRGNSYEFKLHTKNCLKLCHYFYDGVSPDLYLSRKFNVYMNYLEKSMAKEKLRVLERQ